MHEWIVVTFDLHIPTLMDGRACRLSAGIAKVSEDGSGRLVSQTTPRLAGHTVFLD